MKSNITFLAFIIGVCFWLTGEVVQAQDLIPDRPPVMENYPIATLQGLDKVVARTKKFELTLGETITFGTIEITLRSCQKTTPVERPESAAFLEISEVIEQDKTPLFSGWMFASSPAISAMAHPVYDVWLLDCKKAEKEEDKAP